jgi:tRNA1Val (adenine37-N6)-methyltransferase
VATVERSSTTRDALFGGRVVLFQPARGAGYRVNVDAILLAGFAARVLDGGASPTRRARRAIDLGSGVGAVGLSLLHFDAAAHVTMVEIDPALSVLAAKNGEANAWKDRVTVDERSVADAAAAGDLVVCNPPYVAAGRGRAPDAHRRTARFSGEGGGGALETFVEAARRVASRRARVCFVYPANETTTLLATLRARGLEPKRLRAVHAKAAEPARIVLVEALPAKRGGLVIEPPIVELEGRTRSSIMRGLLDPSASQ